MVSTGLNRFRGIGEALSNQVGIYAVSPARKLLSFDLIPEDTVTNNPFSAPDRKTLYIAAGKSLYKLSFAAAGGTR